MDLLINIFKLQLFNIHDRASNYNLKLLRKYFNSIKLKAICVSIKKTKLCKH